jgi:hypothetical protein
MSDSDGSARGCAADARAGTFDVRGWLAGLSHTSIDAVQFVSEHERSGRRTVTYDCAGSVAKVRMTPLSGTAAWELTAELIGAVDRVLLPGATRFVWRPPPGTHS